MSKAGEATTSAARDVELCRLRPPASWFEQPYHHRGASPGRKRCRGRRRHGELDASVPSIITPEIVIATESVFVIVKVFESALPVFTVP